MSTYIFHYNTAQQPNHRSNQAASAVVIRVYHQLYFDHKTPHTDSLNACQKIFLFSQTMALGDFLCY